MAGQRAAVGVVLLLPLLLALRSAEVAAVNMVSYRGEGCTGAVIESESNVPAATCRVFKSPAVAVRVEAGTTTDIECFEVITYQDEKCQVEDKLIPEVVLSTQSEVCNGSQDSPGVRVAWFPKKADDCT